MHLTREKVHKQKKKVKSDIIEGTTKKVLGFQ